jgi:hypothetical protein
MQAVKEQKNFLGHEKPTRSIESYTKLTQTINCIVAGAARNFNWFA